MKLYKVYILFFLVALFSSCSKEYKEILIINNLEEVRGETVKFEINPDQNVFKRILRIKGHADGRFMIDGIEIPSGRIDTVFSGDWYSPDYYIKYNSIDAKKGMLEVEIELLAL